MFGKSKPGEDTAGQALSQPPAPPALRHYRVELDNGQIREVTAHDHSLVAPNVIRFQTARMEPEGPAVYDRYINGYVEFYEVMPELPSALAI
jgi:hypothetical protein